MPRGKGKRVVFLVGLIALILGIVEIVNPRLTWYLNIGWKLKDAEPSDLALLMNRVGGAFVAFIGLMIMMAS